MIRANHPILKFGEILFAYQHFQILKGLTSAYIAYPYAEKREKRNIRTKLNELRQHYKCQFKQRFGLSQNRLADTSAKIYAFWPGAFIIEYMNHDAFIRVGQRAKFRHVVTV